MKNKYIPILTLGLCFYVAEKQNVNAQPLSCNEFNQRCVKLTTDPKQKGVHIHVDKMCELLQPNGEAAVTACRQERSNHEIEAEEVDTYYMCYQIVYDLHEKKLCINPDESFPKYGG